MSSKITALASLSALQADDVIPVVDVHDTSMASSGTTKRIAAGALLAGTIIQPSGDTSGATDAAAINALVTAGAQQIVLGPGQWYTGTNRISLTAGPGIRILGSGSVMNDQASTNATVINCGGSSSSTGLFFFSHTASLVSGTEIGNLDIVYSGTGNVFDDLNLQSGYFHDLNISLGTQGSACGFFTGPSETVNNSVIQVTLERVTISSSASTRTAPMVSITSQNSGGISDLTFLRCKFNNNGQDHAQPAVLVQCTATGAGYHYATTFRDCYFEKPLGGAIKSLSGSGLLVDHCMFWDMTGLTIGASTVYVGAGAGNIGSQGVKITGCGRNRNGPGGSSAWDVECESTTSQVVVEGFHILAAGQSTQTNAFFNFHGCNDVVLMNNVSPQGSSVNGNSTTVVTNPSPTQVVISGGAVNGTPAGLQPSGDATGATDTAAINASLTANPLTILAPGQWYITNVGFTVNTRRLLGSGPGTVLNVVASSPGLVFSGPGQVEVSGFAMVIGAGSYGMTVNGLYDAHIHDIWMTGSTAAGGIKINGDDALEQHYTDIVMRTVGGVGFDYERTTSIYTGSLYLDRVRMVTPPAAATGFRFNSTAGSPSLNTVFMTQCVADAFFADAYYANDVAQVFATQCWFAIIAGAAGGTVAMRITGGSLQHSYDGCYTYNGLTSGTDVLLSGALNGVSIGGGHVFDGAGGNTALSLSGATTAAGGFVLGAYLNYCGTLTDSPVALSFGGQAASPPVFYTDGSGGASQNIAIIDAANPSGNTKYIRNGGGALQILNNAFSQVLLALADNGALTLGGNVTVQANDAVLNVISTLAAQFNGPAIGLYNAITSLGQQGGVQLQVGINDAGITQGYATLVQVDHNGSYVRNLITIDLNAQTIAALIPLVAQAGLSMANNKITNMAIGTTSTDAATLGQVLPASGGTMSGAIAMGAHKITGLANGTVSTDAAAFGQTPAGGAIVSGQFLCTPTQYGPGTATNLTTTSATMSAVSSANVNTGSFTAPASGSVLVSVSGLVTKENTANARQAFGLADHGTTTMRGNVLVFDDNGTSIPRLYGFQVLVTGLTPGNSYNFDLMFATVSADTMTVIAFGQSTSTPTLSTGGNDGAAITMAVQAV